MHSVPGRFISRTLRWGHRLDATPCWSCALCPACCGLSTSHQALLMQTIGAHADGGLDLCVAFRTGIAPRYVHRGQFGNTWDVYFFSSACVASRVRRAAISSPSVVHGRGPRAVCIILCGGVRLPLCANCVSARTFSLRLLLIILSRPLCVPAFFSPCRFGSCPEAGPCLASPFFWSARAFVRGGPRSPRNSVH